MNCLILICVCRRSGATHRPQKDIQRGLSRKDVDGVGHLRRRIEHGPIIQFAPKNRAWSGQAKGSARVINGAGGMLLRTPGGADPCSIRQCLAEASDRNRQAFDSEMLLEAAGQVGAKGTAFECFDQVRRIRIKSTIRLFAVSDLQKTKFVTS